MRIPATGVYKKQNKYFKHALTLIDDRKTVPLFELYVFVILIGACSSLASFLPANEIRVRVENSWSLMKIIRFTNIKTSHDYDIIQKTQNISALKDIK